MKIKVFLLNYLLSIFCLVFLFITLLIDGDHFNKFMSVLLLIICIANPLLSDKQYVSEFHLYDDRMEIRYITSLLTVRSIQVSFSSIESIELKGRNWFIIYPPAVEIRYEGEWRRFYIIHKDLLNSISDALASHSMGSVKISSS